MATIQRPVKTYGTRSYVGEVGAAPGNLDPILGSEVDADLDTIYAAWNGGVDTVNVKPGSITYASLAPDAQLWRDTGTTLTPGTNFTSRTTALAPVANALQWGTTTVKHRLTDSGGNADWRTNVSNGTVAIDDQTKAQWAITMAAASDGLFVYRSPPGATPAWANLLKLDATGQLTLPTFLVQHVSPALVKTRVLTHNNYNTYFTNNYDSVAGTQDDAARPSWLMVFGSTGNDNLLVRRAAPGGTPANLLTLDSAGGLHVNGNASGGGVTVGENSNARGQLGTWLSNANPILDLTANVGQFMTFRPVWMLRMNTDTADSASFQRQAVNGGAWTAPFTVIWNGDITTIGANATKNGGSTTWIITSDPRLKDDIAPYHRGLADILPLEPIRYRLKSRPDLQCYGFDAAAVRDVFPECVSETRMKLDPDDEEETDGVLAFDMHPILVTMVTAIKELAARVAALEAA
jgi:hypothetical protein